jgi:hypothetical protein
MDTTLLRDCSGIAQDCSGCSDSSGELAEPRGEPRVINVRPCVPRRTLSRDEFIVLESRFFP